MTETKSSSSTARSNENEREDVITARQGQLIDNFLDNNASHLIVYGLFCLQDGLKDLNFVCYFAMITSRLVLAIKFSKSYSLRTMVIRFLEEKTLIMPCWITWLESLRKQRE